MSATPSRSTTKVTAITLFLMALVLGASAGHAADRPLRSRDVSWTYDMDDGSTIRMEVDRGRVLVESPAAEYWTVVNANLLVSPDGLRQIRLMRDFNGTVDRIEMQVTKAR